MDIDRREKPARPGETRLIGVLQTRFSTDVAPADLAVGEIWNGCRVIEKIRKGRVVLLDWVAAEVTMFERETEPWL